jgi:sugar-specific transcriptional regulator TrmB
MLVLNGHSREIIEKFHVFGLCEYESRAYFALQVCGRTKANDLWKKAGLPQSRIYCIIQQLMMKGLVEITKNYPLEVRAKPFLRFANEFLTERKCLLGEIKDMIEGYKEAMKNNEKFVRVVI